jgi:hypothetical protein
MRRLMTCAIIVGSAMPGFAAPAGAADPAFCKGYTNAALNQVQLALTDPKCAVGAQGVRWSTAFPVHYEWCLGVSLAAAGVERDARTGYLRGCR